jgi:hypothetical protein
MLSGIGYGILGAAIFIYGVLPLLRFARRKLSDSIRDANYSKLAARK